MMDVVPLSLDEQFFCQLALKNRLITEPDARRAIDEKKRVVAGGGEKTLAEAFLDLGLLTPREVDRIHEAQAASQVVRLDSLYGDLALCRGLVDEETLVEIYEEQRRQKFKIRAGELLVDRGIITPHQHRELLIQLLSHIEQQEREYIRAIRLKPRMEESESSETPFRPSSSVSKRERSGIGTSQKPASGRWSKTGSGKKKKRKRKKKKRPKPRPAAEGPHHETADELHPGQESEAPPALPDVILEPESTDWLEDSSEGERFEDESSPELPTAAENDPLAGEKSHAFKKTEKYDTGAARQIAEEEQDVLASSSFAQHRRTEKYDTQAAREIEDEEDVLAGSSFAHQRRTEEYETSTAHRLMEEGVDPRERETDEIVSPHQRRTELIEAPDEDSLFGRQEAGRDSGLGSARDSGMGQRGSSGDRSGGLATRQTEEMIPTPTASSVGEGFDKTKTQDMEPPEFILPNEQSPAYRSWFEDEGGEPMGEDSSLARKQLLESAVMATREASPEKMSGLLESDILFVKSDLENVSELLESGFRSFKELGKLQSSSTTGQVFDAESYLRKKKQKKVLKLTIGIGGTAIFLLFAIIYFTIKSSNQGVYNRAVQLYEAGELTAAAEAAGEAGGIGVDEDAVRDLKKKIQLTREWRKVQALADDGDWTGAKKAVGQLLDSIGPDGDPETSLEKKKAELRKKLKALDKRCDYQKFFETGRKHEEEGNLQGAIGNYHIAAKLYPGKETSAKRRIDAIRQDLLGQIGLEDLDVSSIRSVERLEDLIGACNKYSRIFGEEEEIEETLHSLFYRKYLLLGDKELAKATKPPAVDLAVQFYLVAKQHADTQEIREREEIAGLLRKYLTFYERGTAQYRAKRYAEARRSFEDALAVAKTLGDDEKVGKLTKLIRTCKEKLQREVVESKVRKYYDEGIAALRENRIKDAQKVFAKLVGLKKENERFQEIFAFVMQLDEMVYVEPGPFRMGSTVQADEKPAQKIFLTGFFIDKYEVTNEKYGRFVLATGHRVPAHWQVVREIDGKERAWYPPDRDRYPVVNVSWEDARAYARWAEKALPQETQWEKAARGTDGRKYPWGDYEEVKINVQARKRGRNTILTAPVGSYEDDRSPFGCYDMAGNVSEWTRDTYSAYPDGPMLPEYDGQRKALRGGSWAYELSYGRCANRDRSRPDNYFNELGFRCVKEIPDVLADLKSE